MDSRVALLVRAPIVVAMAHVAEGPETTARLQAFTDRLNANVAVADRDGTIEVVNRGWVRFAAENGDPGGAHTEPVQN